MRHFLMRVVRILAQVVHKSFGCPIPRNIQIQVGWGLEQPAVVEDVASHGTGFGLDDLQCYLPTQTIL